MAKVTKEVMKSLIDAGIFPPRHQRSCPKNYARTMPLIYAAIGLTIDEMRDRIKTHYDSLPCECKKQDVLREW